MAIHLWVNMYLKEYLHKIEGMLNKNGILLLESHNIEEEEKNFEKDIMDILGDRFVIEKEGIIKDDNVIKRKFIILRKK